MFMVSAVTRNQNKISKIYELDIGVMQRARQIGLIMMDFISKLLEFAVTLIEGNES